jgi:hypothetical protein
MAATARGSTSSQTSPARTLSNITGTNDFSAQSLSDWDVLANRERVLDITDATSSVRALVATRVASASGTGGITLAWSGTAISLLQVWVLPPSDVIEVDDNGINDSTSLGLMFAETLEENDIAFAMLAQMHNQDFTPPTGWTASGLYTSASINRFESAWKNGSLSASPPFTGLYNAVNTVPKALVGVVLRRTA